MTRPDQCFRACALLSTLLTTQNIPHAFSGGFLTVALGSPRETEVRSMFLPGRLLVWSFGLPILLFSPILFHFRYLIVSLVSDVAWTAQYTQFLKRFDLIGNFLCGARFQVYTSRMHKQRSFLHPARSMEQSVSRIFTLIVILSTHSHVHMSHRLYVIYNESIPPVQVRNTISATHNSRPNLQLSIILSPQIFWDIGSNRHMTNHILSDRNRSCGRGGSAKSRRNDDYGNSQRSLPQRYRVCPSEAQSMGKGRTVSLSYSSMHPFHPHSVLKILPVPRSSPHSCTFYPLIHLYFTFIYFYRGPNVSNSRRDPCDAHDVMFILTNYWEAIDINRIVELDMEAYVRDYPEAKTAWKAIRRRYTV